MLEFLFLSGKVNAERYATIGLKREEISKNFVQYSVQSRTIMFTIVYNTPYSLGRKYLLLCTILRTV